VPRASPRWGDPFGGLEREAAHRGWPSTVVVVMQESSMATTWARRRWLRLAGQELHGALMELEEVVGADCGRGRRSPVRKPHDGLALVLRDSLVVDGGLSAAPIA
jgi:hypothetical protein